jgi:hypothetical protein
MNNLECTIEVLAMIAEFIQEYPQYRDELNELGFIARDDTFDRFENSDYVTAFYEETCYRLANPDEYTLDEYDVISWRDYL